MLLSKQCPHTGVVNFYEASEPYISIASITKCGTSAASERYTWRFYASEGAPSGSAPDERSAEQKLLSLLSKKSVKRCLELH